MLAVAGGERRLAEGGFFMRRKTQGTAKERSPRTKILLWFWRRMLIPPQSRWQEPFFSAEVASEEKVRGGGKENEERTDLGHRIALFLGWQKHDIFYSNKREDQVHRRRDN